MRVIICLIQHATRSALCIHLILRNRYEDTITKMKIIKNVNLAVIIVSSVTQQNANNVMMYLFYKMEFVKMIVIQDIITINLNVNNVI